jgi:hypothetical protein
MQGFFSFLLNTAIQISGFSNMIGALVMGALALIVGAVLWHRQRRKEGKSGVEPSHLIIGGLVAAFVSIGVVLYGYVLQQGAQGLAANISDNVAQTRDLSKKETTNETVYAARVPSDADREILIIDQLYGIVRNDMRQQYEKGLNILSRWKEAFDDGKSTSYLTSLSDFSASVRMTNKTIWDIIQSNPQYCENDLCNIDSRQNQNVDLSFQNFRFFLERMIQMHDREKMLSQIDTIYIGIVEPAFARPSEQIASYSKWIGSTQNWLEQRRKQLSKAATGK